MGIQSYLLVLFGIGFGFVIGIQGGVCDAFKLSIREKQQPSHVRLLTIYPDVTYANDMETYNDWSHGEVPWESAILTENEPYAYAYDNNRNNILKDSTITFEKESDQEQLWYFLQETEFRASVSGVFKSIVAEMPIMDSIISNVQNIQDEHSQDFETLIGLFVTIAIYNSSKQNEINNLRNVDINKYMKIKKMASLWMVCMMILFTKNVKNAM
jgi:hypothetical protein